MESDPARKSGQETLTTRGRQLPFELHHFWQWSGSDLLANTQRGILAEYIVACDLGVADGVRIEWDSYDLKTRSGISVEVKPAAYLQSWHQSRPSTITFSVAPSLGWDAATGKYDAHRKRRAKVYVFCLLHHQDKATVNPLDLDQWQFLVLPTSRLDHVLGDQQTIALSRLMELEPTRAEFGQIGRAIELLGRPGIDSPG